LKKLTAIALLCLQIFTICGHTLLYQYFAYRSDQIFNDRISRNMYNVHDLVEIKIPTKTQVTTGWTTYQKINGQIQFKNICYNYVKLKLTRDTLYLVCIPNYEKTRLFNQNIINAKDIDDIPVTKKDHVPFGKAADFGKYNYLPVQFSFLSPVVILQASNNLQSPTPIQCCLSVPHQPPKMFC